MTRRSHYFRGWQRAGEFARGLAALVVLLALLVGLPVLLYAVAGVPVPHQLPSPGQVTDTLTRRDDGQLFLACLLVLAWLGWAAFAVCVAVEAAAQLRGHGAPRVPALGGPQRLAGQLVAAVAVAFLGTAPLLTPATPGRLPPTTPVAAVALHMPAVTSAVPPQAAQHREPATSTPVRPRRAAKQYTVARGDTLWGIAEAHLGDPERYREIARLNYGRRQPDGRALTSTHWIYPGWVLLLPADATGIPPAGTPKSETSTPPAPPEHGADPQHAAAPPPQPGGIATRPATPTEPVTPPRATATVQPTSSDTGGHNAPATSAPGEARNQPTADPVELPSGSLVAGSFAAGVAAAVALGRLRRRHAYRPHPPAPGRCLAPSPLSYTLRRLSTATSLTTDEDDPVSSSPPPDALPSDDPDRRNHPDRIDIAHREGESIVVTLTELQGIALSGPGGDDVARAWITATLVRGGPLATEILITAAAAERLFPGRPDVPGMRVVDDGETLLGRVEVATLSRSRQLADADIADAGTYRNARPYEPLPTLIAITEAIPADHAGRWQTAMRGGGPLAIGVLVLADSYAVSTRVDVDADHVAVKDATDAAGVPNGARLFALTADEACDVLLALAGSEERPDSDDLAGDPPPPSDRAADITAAGGLDRTDGQSRTEPWPETLRPAPFGTISVAGPTLPDGNGVRRAAPVAVRLLGPYTISVDGEVVSTGLRSVAKELLAWYLLRPDGATVEAAVDELWPDTDPKQVHRQFWLAASNLRTRLRSAELPDLKVLAQAGDVYRPEAGAISCDLWDFQAALRAAVQASDDTTARTALHAAVDAYGGDFAATTDYLWAEPARADLHRRALDAHLRLAEIEERLGRTDAAAEVLERAIVLDGVAEEPYRRLMTLRARLDRPDALRATWRALQHRLADLDIDPEPATVRLYRSLTEPTDEHKDSRSRRPAREDRIAG